MAGEAHFDQVVRRKEEPDEIPEVEIETSEKEIWLPHLMVKAGLAKSSSEAVRLIKQGAVHVNGAQISDREASLETSGSYVIRRGKRRFVRAKFT